MDFTMIPFNSGLEQLGRLLPIGTFIRLRTVVPSFHTVSLPYRRFERIIVERSSTAFLSMTFVELGNTTSYTVNFVSPEAVLNDGPVECDFLELLRADGVPAEAIACKDELSLGLATPAVLPFLACGALNISFSAEEVDKSQTSVTLEAVMANLGKNVVTLKMPFPAPNDPADIFQIPVPPNKEFCISFFQMHFSTFKQLIEWLRKNGRAMANNRFCQVAYLMCLNHKIRGDEKEELRLHHSYNLGTNIIIFFSKEPYIFS